MPAIKLTERAVAKLKAPTPSGKQEIFWDAELKGFGVLCSGVSNSKTFIVQRLLPSGLQRRATIASVAEMPLAKARDAAAEVLLSMRQGRDPKSGRHANLTLRQVLDQYLGGRKNLRPLRVENYRDYLTQLSARHELPLRKITAEMVEQRYTSIAAEVKQSGRGNGHATANNVMRTLKALWNYAAERDPELPANPVRRLARVMFKVPRRTRLVKADDLPAFYAAVDELPNKVAPDFILLMLFTGLRKTEAASLKWADVDFKARVVRIPAGRTKADRPLDLPMTDFIHDMLVARRAIGDAMWVFPSSSESGRIMDARFPLAQVAAQMGIEISAHDLRRTFCTVAESCDISPLALKALVNHAIGGDVTSG